MSDTTSTMKEAERLTAMAEKCGATVYRNRASVHSPAVAFGDESWARFCETIVGLVTAAAQARSLVEAQPCAVAGPFTNEATFPTPMTNAPRTVSAVLPLKGEVPK